MKKNAIFISHSSRDTDFVIKLRQSMEAKGLYNFVDSRELRGTDELAKTIHTAIEEARAFIVVISTDAFNSAWVAEETRYASQVKEKLQGNYPIIPLLREGIELGALKWIFTQKPVAIRVTSGPEGIRRAMPQILAALGKKLPNDPQPIEAGNMQPVEELVLDLKNPYIEKKNGKHQAFATAELIYIPASQKHQVECREPFLFTAPLGFSEIEELRWYLEQYYLWPTGTSKKRAQNVESRLPEWGYELWREAMWKDICTNVLTAWREINPKAERRFTVFANSQLVKGGSVRMQMEANEASVLLLALPWELLYDGANYLFQGAKSVMARHQLSIRKPRELSTSGHPIRILLISPIPEIEKSGYIEHRVSSFSVMDSIETIGDVSEVTVLTPVTFPALKKELERAQEAQTPYHAVHFDGHGVYKKDVGLGGLCFHDTKKDHKFRSHIIHSDKLAQIVQEYGLHLFFSRSLSIKNEW